MFLAWRRRSLPWAALGACVAVACQFPDYVASRSLSDGGSSSTSLAGASGGNLQQAGSAGGVGAGNVGGATGTGGLAGASGSPSSGGTADQPVAGTGGAGQAGSAEGGDGAGGDSGNPTLLLEDGFETNGAEKWLEVAGSPWSVALDAEHGNNAYQLTSVFGDFYASVAKDGPWTDQIFAADVKILAFGGTSTSDVVSLLGRFGNIDNYYAAVLRADGRVAIRVRLAGASPKTLKTSAALGITTGTWYRVRFELQADALRLYIDDQLKVEALDSSLTKGTVALGGDNSAAAFDNVRVSSP